MADRTNHRRRSRAEKMKRWRAKWIVSRGEADQSSDAACWIYDCWITDWRFSACMNSRRHTVVWLLIGFQIFCIFLLVFKEFWYSKQRNDKRPRTFTISRSLKSWILTKFNSCSASSEIGPDGEMKKKKKKKSICTLSVTSMLKKFQREKEKERQKVEKSQKAAAIVGVPTIPLCPADAAGGGGSGLTDPLLSLIGSINDHALIQAANTVDFDIDLDSWLDVTEGTLSPKMFPQPAAETQLFQPKTEDQTQVQPPGTKTRPHSEPVQVQSQPGSTSPHLCVPLPDGLPPALGDSIRKLTAVRLNFVVCVCWFSACDGCTDDLHSFFRLPRPQRANPNSSSSRRRSTQSCSSELSNNKDETLQQNKTPRSYRYRPRALLGIRNVTSAQIQVVNIKH